MSQGILGEVAMVARGVLRRPAFGATVVLVMALGIGAVTTMFSTMDSVVLRPLPFDQPGNLVWLYSSSRPSPAQFDVGGRLLRLPSAVQIVRLGSGQGVFSPAAHLSVGPGTEPYRYTLVSHNFFSTLRVRRALGRTFVPADELAGGAHVVVVSHRFWRDYMGGRADILQQSLDLDGTARSVVGVMPADFAFPEGVDLWLPLRHDHPEADGRGNNNFSMFGRLRPGVGLEAARAEATVLARRIEQAHPDTKAGWGLLLTPMHEVFFGDYRPAMTMLMAAVVLLLLVACANVSSLFLARGVEPARRARHARGARRLEGAAGLARAARERAAGRHRRSRRPRAGVGRDPRRAGAGPGGHPPRGPDRDRRDGPRRSRPACASRQACWRASRRRCGEPRCRRSTRSAGTGGRWEPARAPRSGAAWWSFRSACRSCS